MTPEEKDLLQKTYALTQENNEMLLKLRKSAKLNGVLKWVYWGIIILLTVGSIYLAGPFLQGIAPSQSEINSLTSPN